MQPVLCFGEALIDFHSQGRDERGFAQQFVPFAGGAPANVAVAVARLGGEARFAGMLGTDRSAIFCSTACSMKASARRTWRVPTQRIPRWRL